jgi:hypothetical protein
MGTSVFPMPVFESGYVEIRLSGRPYPLV